MTSFLGVPVTVHGRSVGNLYLTDKRGATEFSEVGPTLVEMFALRAGIAIDNARLHEQVQRLAVVEERERISRDLHDGIIQSIYGVALSLEDVPVPHRRLPRRGVRARRPGHRFAQPDHLRDPQLHPRVCGPSCSTAPTWWPAWRRSPTSSGQAAPPTSSSTSRSTPRLRHCAADRPPRPAPADGPRSAQQCRSACACGPDRPRPCATIGRSST